MADATINIDRVTELTGRLRDSHDPEVAELARAAYEMANAIVGVSLRLTGFSYEDSPE